jgi:hypothetical protein
MNRLTALWVAGVGLLTVAFVVGQIQAAMDGEANEGINKVADLLEKGDTAAATKLAHTVAEKNELDIIMSAFALRKKKGIGIGPTANAITPDGVELKIEALARDGISPDALKKEGPALVRTGYVMSAVGDIALAKSPAKDVGKQKKADFIKWAQDLTKAGGEFAVAAKGGSAAEVKKAANKVKQSCDSCHAVFK